VPDVQYRPLGTVSAPAAWTLQDLLEILPKTAYAHYDGSGTAGPFQPCLRIISDAGIVAGEYICETEVAAGASADVTWFRGVGAGSSNVPVTGAWTQVFHYDVPALSTAASIDTTGFAWSNANNNIFGIFVGQTNTAAHNEELWCQFNGDTVGHYGYGYQYGNAYISGTPGVFGYGANVLDVHGSLGLIGGAGDTLGFSAIQFWIPKVYQTTNTGKLIATGGYAGLVSGVQSVAVTSYEFTGISRLKLYPQTGSQFVAGTSLTLWAV
jgi:hypothetical protein